MILTGIRALSPWDVNQKSTESDTGINNGREQRMTNRINNRNVSHSLRSMSDEWLVLAAKDGDANAFVELRDRHSRKILRMAYRITKNWEDAEDTLQGCFLKVFIHLNKFEGRCSFFSWASKIAINTSLMIMRKKRANQELPIATSDHDCEYQESWKLRDFREDPERRYARYEGAELLRGAIRRLPPTLRTAVELQQTQDYSTRELADSRQADFRPSAHPTSTDSGGVGRREASLLSTPLPASGSGALAMSFLDDHHITIRAADARSARTIQVLPI